MATASLQLLKGKGAQAPAPEPEPVVEAAAEEVEVDVDGMTGPQLDALVKEHGIEVPTSWWKQENGVKKLTVPEKKDLLKKMFGGDEPAPETAPAPAETPEAVVAELLAAAAPVVEEAPKVGKVTKVSKKTGTAVGAAVKHGEVLGPDALTDIVHEIENLSEEAAKQMVASLAEAEGAGDFRLGGVLSVIQNNSWFTPYASLREYVEKEHGIHYRKALYCIKIYNGLTEAKIPWTKVAHLGWTKLKELAGIMTQENMAEWVKIAESNNVQTLIETIAKSTQAKAQAQLSGDAQAADTPNVAAISTKTFKLHDDQKATVEAALEKAKAVANTSVDTVALEYICLEYLGSKPQPVATLIEQLQAVGVESALETLGEAFPQVNITAELPD